MATWTSILKSVSNDATPGLANVQALPDFNELARRIAMAKQDRERALGRERQAFEAARKAQAATEECMARLKEFQDQWRELTGEILSTDDD